MTSIYISRDLVVNVHIHAPEHHQAEVHPKSVDSSAHIAQEVARQLQKCQSSAPARMSLRDQE